MAKGYFSNLTPRKVVVGAALGLAALVAGGAGVFGYLACEDKVAQAWFCSDYKHVAGKPLEVQKGVANDMFDQHMRLDDWHPSNRDRYVTRFLKALEKC